MVTFSGEAQYSRKKNTFLVVVKFIIIFACIYGLKLIFPNLEYREQVQIARKGHPLPSNPHLRCFDPNNQEDSFRIQKLRCVSTSNENLRNQGGGSENEGVIAKS